MPLLITELNRRGAAALAAALATGTLILRGGIITQVGAEEENPSAGKAEQGDRNGEVSATEDLMREHGVLRRTLIVYSELSDRLRTPSETIDPTALAEAAKLFREFGEEYHEQILEEQYVFPDVRKAGGADEKLIEVLLLQHQRGREITDYLFRVGKSGRIGNNAEALSQALAAMSRMYQAHAAWEDTVIFPAWKKSQSKSRLDELAEKFEDIEHERFGKDGFDEALERIGRVEQAFGLADLAAYTARAAPHG
jgi:hemerythrin-like domain-containing protein